MCQLTVDAPVRGFLFFFLNTRLIFKSVDFESSRLFLLSVGLI
jgi:hypothetical protein